MNISHTNFLTEDEKEALKKLSDQLDIRLRKDCIAVIPPSKGKSTTRAGITLPDSALDRSNTAVVVKTPDKIKIGSAEYSPEVGVGDLIVYGNYSGDTIKVGGESLMIIKHSAILAILEP